MYWQRFILALAFLAAGGGIWSGCHGARSGAAAIGAAVRHPTLERTVVVGYQGWFRTPEDGAGMGWTHYRGPGSQRFGPGSMGIDYWPDVSELTPAEKFPTEFRQADGTVAHVFSSHHPSTVDRHFQWMREHGIDAAFVQRFSAPITGPAAIAATRLRATDNVLRYALAGAERHGRGLAVMYDLSGMPAGAMARVMADWKHVVDDLKVRRSHAYQHHGGKPVVVVWGVGFADGRAYTLEECAELIRFLKTDPVYGGNTVMLGIPSFWREQRRDAVQDARLHEVLRLADILSPWTPGRYADLAGVRLHAEQQWLPDKRWCEEHGLGYMPVVFPGFSWRNLKRAEGGIDRVDGRFLWEQYRHLTQHGFTMIYQAMFDEMDEGTQIFKVTKTPPEGARVLTYAPLPADHYLWLVGTAAAFVRRGEAMPERIVERPGHAEVNRFLRANDDRVYAEADERYARLKAAQPPAPEMARP